MLFYLSDPLGGNTKKSVESMPCILDQKKAPFTIFTGWWFFTNPREKYAEVQLDHFRR